ncbi:transcription factor grauzone-like [Calliphora vicina]|uniref:transcription factor grauzone-like n=1 Tax=Calliphora vicina TaxID=7373 RepID=UPI00325A4730
MNCLLCLKIIENVNNRITINSTQWQELNIQFIVEKYLWKMEHLNACSHICQGCWQELYNFHNFYTDIEKAHTNLNTLIKTEVISDDVSSEKGQLEEKIENSQLEPEILLLKEENPLEIFEKEEVEEFSNSKKRLKRKCSTKRGSSDVQNNEKSNSKKKSKKEKSKKGDTNKAENQQHQEKNKTKLKEVENDSKESNFVEDFNDLDDTRYDSDDEPTNTADTFKLHAQRQEHDKFIAENLEITCCICQLPLETFSITVKHYKEEHNQRGYAVCCNRKLYDRSEIFDHFKLHENPEYFKCKYCDKVLSSRVCLKLHIKNIHEHKSIECDICGKSLSTESSLKMHKLMHDAENNEKIPCKQCDKSYLSKYSLANHIRAVHLKSYHKICDLCGASISGKSRFKRHMLEHEGKPAPMVTCEVCGRRLADMKCLKRHMNSHHPPEGVKNEFNCPICMKIFASPSNVKMHIKVVHENSYERKCNLCEKTFKRPDALKDHMAKHIGKPLHSCGWCPKTFYSNGQMHAHRKRVHPIEWQESVREKFSGNLPEKYVSKPLENQSSK